MQKLNELGAREAARRLAAREITAEQLARACLERIEEREATVGAWIHLDPDAVLRQAKQLDAGPVRGPLHGLPIGVKDIIETADMPTGFGSKVYAGMRTAMDAAGFGNCTNHYECEAACPKKISVDYIAMMNRDYAKASFGAREEKKGGDGAG